MLGIQFEAGGPHLYVVVVNFSLVDRLVISVTAGVKNCVQDEVLDAVGPKNLAVGVEDYYEGRSNCVNIGIFWESAEQGL